MSDSTKAANETAINITESRSTKGPFAYTTIAKHAVHPKGGWKRGVAIFDFILRICALVPALAAAAAMGTTEETLPFFTQFFQFQASFDDIPTFTYFPCIPLFFSKTKSFSTFLMSKINFLLLFSPENRYQF